PAPACPPPYVGGKMWYPDPPIPPRPPTRLSALNPSWPVWSASTDDPIHSNGSTGDGPARASSPRWCCTSPASGSRPPQRSPFSTGSPPPPEVSPDLPLCG